jgi:predicted transposase YdaD
MMQIPPELQSQLMHDIEDFERNQTMQPYISSFERRGLERGLERGRHEGQQEALSRLLAILLTQRFGALPPSIDERLRGATPGELQGWGEAVLDAPTLESVFAQR